MAKISVVFKHPFSGEKKPCKVDDKMTATEAVNKFIKKYPQFLSKSRYFYLIEYRISVKYLQLSCEKSLSDSGVTSGDELRLSPDVYPGASIRVTFLHPSSKRICSAMVYCNQSVSESLWYLQKYGFIGCDNDIDYFVANKNTNEIMNKYDTFANTNVEDGSKLQILFQTKSSDAELKVEST
jgi:uncharacterized ubiquitin-like protein YukD